MHNFADARIRDYLDGVGDLLGNKCRRASFASYALGLLAEGDRKSMEPIAMRFCDGVEHADAAHQRLNHFITTSEWSDREVRLYAARHAIAQMLPFGPIPDLLT